MCIIHVHNPLVLVLTPTNRGAFSVVPIYTVAYLQHDVIEWSRVFGQAIGTYVLIFASVNYLFYKSIRERAERDE